MIIVSIESTAVNEKSGNKGGKDWKMRFQQVLIQGVMVDGFESRYPRETSIELQDNAEPYPPGQYVVGSGSYFFGDFGRFSMGRLKLQPLAAYIAELEKTLGVKVSSLKAAA